MLSFSPGLLYRYAEIPFFIILTYALIGVLSSIFVGCFVECRIRNRYADVVMKGLSAVLEDSSKDLLQVVSRDLTTIFERISWYAHDIAWIFTLMIIGMGSLVVGFGVLGSAIAVSLLAASCLLYRACIGELLRTRIETVYGFGALMDAARSAIAIGHARGTSLGWDRRWLDSALAQCPGVRLVVGLRQVLKIQAGVYLGRRDIRVAQHVLHCTQILRRL